jgi:uncharacterized membrane protein/YHS domain-containing protein
MLSYLIHFIHAFLPAALMTGMLIALWRPVYGKKATGRLLGALAAGLLAGTLIFLVSRHLQTVTAARAFLCAAGIFTALLNAANLLVPEKRGRALAGCGWWGALFFLATLSGATAFSFLGLVSEEALSVIPVLNTELILNIAGLLGGAFILGYLIPLGVHLSAKNSKAVVWRFLLLACVLSVLPWCAEVLLGLMRLEVIQLTSLRLSFVAKITKYAYLAPYFQTCIVLALAALSVGKGALPAPAALALLEKSEQRKVRSRVIFEARWFKSALVLAGVILCVLLYHDLYASRPPKISPALRLLPDAGGLIRIKIADVEDGKLHRYSYVTDDGHVVRFFLINRMSSGGGKKIGVVYDACMLCGDMGYLQQKNDIVCIACNVRIFVPSIGKEGGCNPIPLKHEVAGESVVISVRELEKGARYFSEVVPVRVKDPVTGREHSSLNAPFRYEYQGRTYFFESGESEEKFRNSPEKYAGDRPARFLRVQGYRES